MKPRIPRSLAIPTLVLGVSLGCETTDIGAQVDPDARDTGDTLARDTGSDPVPSTEGVQIGSEGIISACTARALAGDDVLPAFGAPAQAVADGVLGTFSGTLAADTDAAGSLALSATSFAAVEGVDCPDLVLLGLSGTWSALPLLEGPSTLGWALVAPDRTGELVLWASSWQGSATPQLDPADYDTVQLRTDAAIDGTGAMTGTVGFEACLGGVCTVEPWATFEGAR